MAELKSFARTIRMKESIRQYVEAQKGSSFSDKFENMVLFSKESEQLLKESISEKTLELAELKKEIQRHQNICNSLNDIDWYVKTVLEKSKSLNRKINVL